MRTQLHLHGQQIPFSLLRIDTTSADLEKVKTSNNFFDQRVIACVLTKCNELIPAIIIEIQIVLRDTLMSRCRVAIVPRDRLCYQWPTPKSPNAACRWNNHYNLTAMSLALFFDQLASLSFKESRQ